ncbi:MAG TPA: hypothetical protein VGG48_09660 [Rhizomicrobium sp.]|jgi:Ca2+-binding RTX toxin-like protein
MSTITGTSGNDNLTGTSGNDFFNVYQGGTDTINGAAGDDVINFGAAFTAADTVNGGTGSDTLELKGAYNLTFGATTLSSVEQVKLAAGFNYTLTENDANVAAGQTLTINGANLGAADVLTFDGSKETNGTLFIDGGAGNDSVAMGGHLTAADRINGGGGSDTVYLGGADYSFGFTTETIRNVSDLVLFGGNNYHFVTNDANIAAGQTMNVDGNSIGVGNTEIFNASHETDGNLNFDVGAGTMELTGGAGDDVFFAGTNLTNSDRLNGGAGSDVLYMGGADYNISIGKSVLQSVDNIHLGQGYDYHLTTNGSIATNATLVMDTTNLLSTDTLYLNFSKETAGSVDILGGAAASTIVGTQQGDAFYYGIAGVADFTASDKVDGQGGYDLLYFDGQYTGANAVVLTNAQVVNVEQFIFEYGHSYDVTIAAGTIAANSAFTVDADKLVAGNDLTFNGAAASSTRSLDVIAGAGDDTITGGNANDTFDLSMGGTDTLAAGAGNDTINMGASLTTADQIDGGTGSDVVLIDGVYMNGNDLVLEAGTLSSVEDLQLGNSNPANCYNITTTDPIVAAGKQLVIDGSLLNSGQSLTFDGSAETDGHFLIIGGADADDLTGGAQSDTFAYSTTIGVTGALRDTINAFDFANDRIAFATVSAIATALNAGTVNASTIDANLTSLLTAARLPAHEALLFTPNAGNLAGHTFLIVDGNGTAGYQTGQDLVIELSGALHVANISTADFLAGL